MTTTRLMVLLAALIAGFGSVLWLPASRFDEPVGVRLALPQYLGRWEGVDQQITEREKTVLASDTEFARKVYTDGFGNAILVSIILSGHDLDDSIHRPERCLPAQGLTIVDSRRLNVPMQRGSLEVTRLHDVGQFTTPEGKQITIYGLNYYWFVGYNQHTASHLERTFLDIKDRLLKGYNQRWAYITVNTQIMDGLMRFGHSEKETDVMLEEFIRQLVPRLTSPVDE